MLGGLDVLGTGKLGLDIDQRRHAERTYRNAHAIRVTSYVVALELREQHFADRLRMRLPSRTSKHARREKPLLPILRSECLDKQRLRTIDVPCKEIYRGNCVPSGRGHLVEILTAEFRRRTFHSPWNIVVFKRFDSRSHEVVRNANKLLILRVRKGR